MLIWPHGWIVPFFHPLSFFSSFSFHAHVLEGKSEKTKIARPFSFVFCRWLAVQISRLQSLYDGLHWARGCSLDSPEPLAELLAKCRRDRRSSSARTTPRGTKLRSSLWPVNSNARTGEKAKEISKSRNPKFPNFLGLVLGCIEASKQASKQARSSSPSREKEKRRDPGMRVQLKYT